MDIYRIICEYNRVYIFVYTRVLKMQQTKSGEIFPFIFSQVISIIDIINQYEGNISNHIISC